jgi:hypothetical protein
MHYSLSLPNACSINEDMRNVYTAVVERPEGNRPEHTWKDNITWVLKI